MVDLAIFRLNLKPVLEIENFLSLGKNYGMIATA